MEQEVTLPNLVISCVLLVVFCVIVTAIFRTLKANSERTVLDDTNEEQLFLD